MAKDYSGRINALKARRQGLNIPRSIEKSLVANALSLESLAIDDRDFEQEEYETRGKSIALKYALGAMQQVDEKYTSISFEEAGRVSSQVVAGFSNLSKSVTTELQGSLPLNVHLRRVSDVDLLVLPDYFCVYSTLGVRANEYTPSLVDSAEEILALRGNCFEILRRAYYAAEVDNSGAKCITVTGGSLRRDVDVVPALWFDSIDYQHTLRKSDRGVKIYDKNDKVFSKNYPFKVQENINNKDSLTRGGCKKVIRLLKTLKIDADSDIKLSSFDIMSIVFAMDSNTLNHHKFYEGMLILSIRDWLRYLLTNPNVMRGLDSVDKSRKIINSKDDEEGISLIYQEVVDLVNKIGLEMEPYDYSKRSRVLTEMIF